MSIEGGAGPPQTGAQKSISAAALNLKMPLVAAGGARLWPGSEAVLLSDGTTTGHPRLAAGHSVLKNLGFGDVDAEAFEADIVALA